MHFARPRVMAAPIAALALLAAPMVHAELILNGGFETGNLNGWTASGNLGFTGVDGFAPHSGTFAAFSGAINTPAVLSQTIATIVGLTYHVSFWLQNESFNGATTPNSFEFLWGGVSEVSLVNEPAFGYTQYQFDLTATAATTALQFRFVQNPAFWDLDDVSVLAPVTVPEPGSFALAWLALGLLAWQSGRGRRVSVSAALSAA